MKKKSHKLKMIVALLLTMMLVCPMFAACGAAQSEWAVYLYLCGSSLESKFGSGTNNLVELVSAKLPAGAKVIIQTGGAKEWKTEDISSDNLQRWSIENGQLKKLESLPNASMGDGQTLEGFLDFCRKNYPAKKEALVLWNHGGGSLFGVCYDTNFKNDALTLKELEQALEHNSKEYERPLEMIGFDACLMATMETATLIAPYANYMVASEETEPMGGWDYTTLAQSLTKEADGAALGQTICDSYIEKCKASGKDTSATISVVDLKKTPEISEKLSEVFLLAEEKIEEGQGLGVLVRAAYGAHKFGGTNEEEGHSNLVDIGRFSDILGAEELKKAVENAVVYQTYGQAQTGVSGLSFFYPVNIDNNQLKKYTEICPAKGYGIYLKRFYSEVPSQTIELVDKGSMTADGHMQISIKNSGYLLKAEINLITSLSREDGMMAEDIYGLGKSDEVTIDFEKGAITDTFSGKWPTIGGYELFITHTEPGTGVYSAPILLNGEQTNLRFMRNLDESFSIFGTWKGIDPEYGIADKDMRQLVKGDRISAVYQQLYTQDNSAEMIAGKEIVVDETSVIENTMMNPKNAYQYSILLTDIFGNTYESNTAAMTYSDGLLKIVYIV